MRLIDEPKYIDKRNNFQKKYPNLYQFSNHG